MEDTLLRRFTINWTNVFMDHKHYSASLLFIVTVRAEMHFDMKSSKAANKRKMQCRHWLEYFILCWEITVHYRSSAT